MSVDKVNPYPLVDEKAVIDKAIVVWDYLHLTGASTKIEAYHALKLDLDQGFCPFCQYTTEVARRYKTKDTCINCPAWGYWDNGEGDKGCVVSPTSAYRKWANKTNTKEERKKAALKMVELIKQVKVDKGYD